MREALFICLAWGAVCVFPAVRATRAGEVVAVFNFAQRDDDPACAWLSKGLADLLINQLADLPDLTVVSRDRMQTLTAEYQRLASRPPARTAKDLEPVATMLEARRMVFGDYRVAGGRAEVTVRVISIDDEKVLFESSREGPYADVLNVERELASPSSRSS